MAKKDKKAALPVRKPRARSQVVPATRRFSDIFGQPLLPVWWGGFTGEEAVWTPAIHVLEKEDRFIAKVELPGVHEDDISVSLVGDTLIVEGEKHAESELKRKGYYYSETSYGSFSRSIAIPSVVDIDSITANFDKGVLEIDLPKAVHVKPKRIIVTANNKGTANQDKPATSEKEDPGKK